MKQGSLLRPLFHLLGHFVIERKKRVKARFRSEALFERTTVNDCLRLNSFAGKQCQFIFPTSQSVIN